MLPMKQRNGLRKMIDKIIAWWKSLFYQEYKLTIYFGSVAGIDEDGKAMYMRTPKFYNVREIISLKPNIIKFIDIDKNVVEIKSHEPMNWDLVRVA